MRLKIYLRSIARLGTILVMFITCNQHHVCSQNDKLANTLLWEVSRGDMKNPSYLFGTMHVSSKVAFHLQDSFLTAISNVDYVCLELNPESWLAEMCNSSLFNEIISFYSNASNSGDFYQQVATINPPNRMILKAALVDNSSLINNLLYRFSGGTDNRNYEETTYLDLYIYQLGKKLRKKMYGLEKFDQTLEMAFKAMLPDEDSDDNLADNYEKFANTINILQEIESAYRNWNLNMIDSLMRLTYISKNYEKYLITERNNIMLNSMDSLMKSGSVFCGVGAAHLPGKNGLINLLRSNGYIVKPVMGKESFASRKKRDKVEKKTFTHSFNSYYASDSTITYNLPGKLLEIPTENEHRFLLYPDMVNGVYYVIYRLQHYSRIFGRTEKEISLTIDSLLYENIPGKILTKKDIKSNTGYPGVELSSKLPSGDYMQFHIYYTPLEVIIIKAGGSEDDYKSNNWNKFFSSIQFSNNENTNSWSVLNQTNYNYTIELPSIRAIHSFSNEDVINSRVQAFDKKDSSYYFISVNSLNDFDYIEDDTFELNYISDLIAKKLEAKITEKNLDVQDNKPVINASLVFNKYPIYLQNKIVIDKNKFYILLAAGNDSVFDNSFFDSFKITNYFNDKIHFLLIDSALQFQTRSDDSLYNKNIRFKDIISKATGYNFPDFNHDDYSSENLSSVFYSTQHPSAIEVYKSKISKYKQISSIDSFLTDHDTYYYHFENGNYVSTDNRFSHSPINQPDSTVTYKYLLKDSMSSRAIWIKDVLINDHLYTLSTIIDTNQGPNNWQETFYQYFQPWDTCNTIDLLASKDKQFIHDLNTDTSFISNISNSSNLSSLIKDNPNVISKILRFLESEKYKSLTIDEKCDLINLVGYVDTSINQCITVLKSLYENAQDTSKLQIEILTALAKYKKEIAIEAISELMEKNLPLTDKSYELWGLFYEFNDSIEISSLLFPTILNYYNLPEYKKHILKLMAKLAINDQLTPSMWHAHKSLILRDAQTELKRYVSKNANNGKNDSENKYSSYRSNKKYSTSLPWKNASSSKDKIACYTVILSINYKTDSKVKKFIDEVMATKDKELAHTCAYALRNNEEFKSDTIWNWIASEDEARMYLCDWLEKTYDTLLYPGDYYSQDMMAISWLTAIPNSYEKKDSIQYIKKILSSDIYEEGYVYVYKYKDDDDWKLNYVGFQPSDTTKMVSDFKHYSKSGIILKDDTEETLNSALEEIQFRIRAYGRKRVKHTNIFPYNNYDFDDYFD